jgi:hypothetical protein
MTRPDDEDMSLSNGSLSDVQEEGSAMNLKEIKKQEEHENSNSNSMSAKDQHEKPIVPLLNLIPKKKNSSPLKEELNLTAEGNSNLTGPIPLIFQEFDVSNRMPYVNSSRIHNPQVLTDRSSYEVNEIDKIVDKVNMR